MAIYKYQKAKSVQIPSENIIFEPESSQLTSPNLWKSVGSNYKSLKNVSNSSKFANFIIPSVFILTGIVLIYFQVLPTIVNYFNSVNNVGNQGNTSVVSENYIDLSKYVSNPAGLSLVTKEAFTQDILQKDVKSNSFRGIFYISIPSLGIETLPVQANVDSTTEEIYNAVLKNSLAHFENTGLPFSDISNNIVIYGHSASPSYNPKITDPEVAFSFLTNLRVGDDIFIDMEGKRYQFRMSRSKIVEPTDFSIITGERNKRTLTLFTCYPPGSNGKRYVAIARPV